jgi:hypothetical protein
MHDQIRRPDAFGIKAACQTSADSTAREDGGAAAAGELDLPKWRRSGHPEASGS